MKKVKVKEGKSNKKGVSNSLGGAVIFCAHAIFYYKLLFRENDTFLMHENVYLIIEDNFETAYIRAEQVARQSEDLNERRGLLLNDEQCAYIFAGIRKLRKILNTYVNIEGQVNFSGEEITYSEFEVDTLEEVERLAAGECVDGVLYRE